MGDIAESWICGPEPERRRAVSRSLGVIAAGLLLAIGLGSLAAAPPATEARTWSGRDPALEQTPGAQVYRESCAACHDAGIDRAPQRFALQDMTPRAIHRALIDGVMREQGAALTADQKIAVAEYITGRPMTHTAEAAQANRCEGERARFDFGKPPPFAGWGLDKANTHAVDSEIAGINRSNLRRLKLKWAFGFAGSNRVRSQPALAGGAIIVGSHNGAVHALDGETGCLRWTFDAEAEVRNGIVVSQWRAGDRNARPLAFFGDVVGNAYAVEAATGKLAWKISADDHPAATLTAAPTLHEGTLYIPVSSTEEAAAAAPGYPCCTFRGSMLAVEAATGREKWRTYLVDAPRPQGTNARGNERFGPSGAAVWNSPVVDAGRGQLYFATSDNYSQPATDMSDAIVALDLATGRIKWHYQALAGDAWNVDCFARASGNCPDNAGPDFGFGAGVVLAKGSDGRERVMAGQKSGWAFAVDPDTGKLDWKRRVGSGGISAGIYFGMAAAGGHLFVPVTDRPDGQTYDYPASPGLHALDIETGEFVWRTAAPDICAGRPLCIPGHGGAISATPELVFAGSDDGVLRVFDAGSGAVLWSDDTVRDIPTVNGVTARGGAISGGAAPIPYAGNLIVASGYGYGSKMPGNVLLVYEVGE
jgi:polyvinyl alcohol dehydrogenase (cytochrome)